MKLTRLVLHKPTQLATMLFIALLTVSMVKWIIAAADTPQTQVAEKKDAASAGQEANSSTQEKAPSASTASLKSDEPTKPQETREAAEQAAQKAAQDRARRAAARAKGELTFDDLKFDIEKDGDFQRSMLTKEIEELDKRTIRIRGYILPQSVFKSRGFEEFVLVRDNQECCFGPGAALYDCIMVRMEKGKKADFVTRPVAVKGKFEIKEFKYPDGEKHYAIYQLIATEVK